MSNVVFVGWARFTLFIAFIASLLSVAGGGLTLPPFKTLGWLVTSTTVVGTYGACPKRSNSMQLFAYDSNWMELQKECGSMFNGPTGQPGRCIVV